LRTLQASLCASGREIATGVDRAALIALAQLAEEIVAASCAASAMPCSRRRMDPGGVSGAPAIKAI
jgi:hypothetical protein